MGTTTSTLTLRQKVLRRQRRNLVAHIQVVVEVRVVDFDAAGGAPCTTDPNPTVVAVLHHPGHRAGPARAQHGAATQWMWDCRRLRVPGAPGVSADPMWVGDLLADPPATRDVACLLLGLCTVCSFRGRDTLKYGSTLKYTLKYGVYFTENYSLLQ